MLFYLFVSLIIRTFQLVFSVKTVFFSHNKSAENNVSICFFSEANGPTLDWILKTYVSSCWDCPFVRRRGSTEVSVLEVSKRIVLCISNLCTQHTAESRKKYGRTHLKKSLIKLLPKVNKYRSIISILILQY